MHLSGLFIYPVKSLRGCAVSAVEVDAIGLVGDRRFLVVDEAGRQITQRTVPRMTLITPELADGQLTLRADGASPINVPLAVSPGTAEPRTVSVWKSEGLIAEDCGDDVARWLQTFLGADCRLVRMGPQFHRPVLKTAAQPADVVAFNDAVPFLALTESALSDLNDRLLERGEDPVPMDRFRPNLVIAGAPAYAEDTWPRVQVGEIVLRAAGPCGRCIMTTVNQLTAEGGKEPLRTLATFRRDAADPTQVNFGQNLIHETKRGYIRVGDSVTPLP